ncbi:MAG TPA: amidohydrolase family protein [Clostridiales bacterium]|nr:amidohydrolase family protein [Clostridiales bacterium]
MTNNKNILLSEYAPKSELVVKEHEVRKPRFNAIDFHIHLRYMLKEYNNKIDYDIKNVVEEFKSFGIKHIVNLDGFPELLDRMLGKTGQYNDNFITTFGRLDFTKIDNPDFDKYVKQILKDFKSKGIKGLKVWKDLNLKIKDKQGKCIPPDDERLRVVWETAADLGLVVLTHIADPKAFFKPININNERFEELNRRPDWSFYGPEYFEFEELMEMQYNMVSKNSDTIFVLSHVASSSENLGYVSECMDLCSNMYVDIAGRISELGRQPYSARKFFNKYQDRILFGTDSTPLGNNYLRNYRFLETWDEYFDYEDSIVPRRGRWEIYGIGLEEHVLEKIYFKNAEKLLGLANYRVKKPAN